MRNKTCTSSFKSSTEAVFSKIVYQKVIPKIRLKGSNDTNQPAYKGRTFPANTGLQEKANVRYIPIESDDEILRTSTNNL